jgi:hypothetical protein
MLGQRRRQRRRQHGDTVEIVRAVVAGGLLRVRLVLKRIGLGLVLALVLEALIPLALLALPALLGSLTPSMANISRR